jgi:hypothetical protein
MHKKLPLGVLQPDAQERMLALAHENQTLKGLLEESRRDRECEAAERKADFLHELDEIRAATIQLQQSHER